MGSGVQGGPSWQAALRALCAVEAVVQQGSSAACGEVAVFFQVVLPLCRCPVTKCLRGEHSRDRRPCALLCGPCTSMSHCCI